MWKRRLFTSEQPGSRKNKNACTSGPPWAASPIATHYLSGFYFIPDCSLFKGAAHIEGRSSPLSYSSSERPSQSYPEVCFPNLSSFQSNKSIIKINHHHALSWVWNALFMLIYLNAWSQMVDMFWKEGNL